MNAVTPLIAIIVGALAYAANRYFKGPDIFYKIIVGVVIVVCVIWFLGVLGVLGGVHVSLPTFDVD